MENKGIRGISFVHPKLREPIVGDELTARERDLLAVIRNSGPITRSDLIKASGLSGPAVFRSTEELAQKGYLLIGDAIAKGRGQPSHEVRLNPEAAVSVGLSVMTDFAEAAIMDLTGRIVAVRNVTVPGMKRDAIFKRTYGFLEDEVKNGFNMSRLVGIGLAVAGFFVGEDDQLNPASELDDWALVDLRSPAEELFGVPVYVENSASAAAVGESLLGIGRTVPTFAYLNFTAGFGGGMILNNRLWRGLSGNAGEFGSVLRLAGQFVPTLESLRARLAEHGVETAGVDDLVTRLAPEWPGLGGWIEEAAQSVRMLSQLIMEIVDVGTVVIGGRLPPEIAAMLAEASQIGQDELDAMQRRQRSRPAPRIVPAEASVRGVALGACALPMTSRVFLPLW